LTQTTGRDPDRTSLPIPSRPPVVPVQREPRARGPLRAWRPGPGGRGWPAGLERGLAAPGRAEILLALLSAVVFSWRVGRPSPWFDEAVTRDVTSRPASEIVDLAEHVDLVHTAYYLLVHAVLGASATVTPIRMLSVVAAVVTTVLLVRLGRELGSARVGAAAALFWTVAPLTTRYAQEARPYALVALAATAATLALVRVCRRPWLRGRWVVYTATLLALGLLNVIGLLLIVVHLTYVLATSSRTVRHRWYAAGGAAVALLTPLLVASARQSEQVAWLPEPSPGQLTGFLLAEYAVGITVVAILVVALAGLGRGTHSPALGLGLAWSLLPPVILWTVSQAHPLYDWRYVFFTVPGSALALASLATLVRRRWVIATVAVLALGGLHMQNVYRYPVTGHAEDVRGAAAAIAAGGRPGDAVLFLPASRRVVELAYPNAFRAVDDVALARTAEDSATLWGVEVPPDDVARALHKRQRVWVVTGPARFGETTEPADREKERLLYNGYRLAGVTFTRSYEVRLYERDRFGAVPRSAASAVTSVSS
jgi:mannosyltransferase